jgi:DNA-directed RNA polymerase specialized sigma24 family protein
MPDVKDAFQPDTITLGAVKEFIQGYKRTNKPQYIEDILIATDPLIISMIFRIKRTYRYLRWIPARELYQVAIIGVYEAIDKIYETDELPEKIPARFNSYIISNVKKTYSYLQKAAESVQRADGQDRDPAWDTPKICKAPNGVEMIVDDLNSLVSCHAITKWDRKLLVDRYIRGMRNDEMAKKREIGAYTVSRRIKLVLKKVAVYFK